MPPRQRYPRSREIDHLTALPPELLLEITSYLRPQLSKEPWVFLVPAGMKPGKQSFIRPGPLHFFSHPDLLALSRTCMRLHRLLTPELVRSLVADPEQGDPLAFAITIGRRDLAAKLLDEGWVEATEKRLVYWTTRIFEDAYMEDAKKEVVELFAERGLGRRLGREWHAMMGLRWPGR